jgi:outer membrane protein assembly factor BamB
MTVKIECACGTRLGFDVEPEGGRMPVEVPCPSCGADMTGLANEFIAAQLAQPRPLSIGGVRMVRHAEPAAAAPAAPAPTMTPPPPPAVAMASNRMSAPPPPAAATSGAPSEPENQPVMKRRVPSEERAANPPGFLARHGIKLGLVAATAVFGFWIWYRFVGSRPKVVYALQTTSAAPFRAAQLVDQNRLLVLTTDKLSLRDTAADSEIWATDVKAPQPKGQKIVRREGDDEGVLDREIEFDIRDTALRLVGRDVWITSEDRVQQFDLGTGKRKAEFAIPGPFAERMEDAEGLTYFTGSSDVQQAVVRIDFATGKKSERTFKLVQRPAINFSELPENGPMPYESDSTASTYFSAKLTAANVVSKRPVQRGPSVVEKENLRAMDSDSAAAEFLRNNTEHDDENLSTYEVTVKWFLTGGSWTGQIGGEPVMIPLRTLDVLVGGKQIIAFSKTGAKLWQASMGFTLRPGRFGDAGGPAIEDSGRVYLWDRGTLNAFDAKKGDALWRLPSVGISRVVVAPGALYVTSTTAGVEQASISDLLGAQGVMPAMLGVDPASGRARWQNTYMGETAVPSGPYLLAWHTRASKLEEMSAAMNQSESSPKLNLYRINPGNGKDVWRWNKGRKIVSVSARDNFVVIHKRDEVEVLKFLP